MTYESAMYITAFGIVAVAWVGFTDTGKAALVISFLIGIFMLLAWGVYAVANSLG